MVGLLLVASTSRSVEFEFYAKFEGGKGKSAVHTIMHVLHQLKAESKSGCYFIGGLANERKCTIWSRRRTQTDSSGRVNV